MTAFSVVALLLLAGLTVVAVHWSRRPRLDSAPARLGTAAVAGVPATPATRTLLRRWRDRSLRWRAVCGAPAFVGTVVAAIWTRQEVHFGFSGVDPLWVQPVPMTLIAACAGAFAAEVHFLRRPADTPRAARISPRGAAAHLPVGARTRRVVLLALGFALTIIALPALGAGAAAGVTALVVLLALPVVQGRIATRPQPVLAPDLTAADDAVRRLAARQADDAAASVAALLLAAQAAAVSEWAGTGLWTPLLFGAQLAAIGVTVLWWVRGAPHRLLPDVDHALAAGATEPAR